MVNEYGAKLDRNGYAPSLIQYDHTLCAYCGRVDEKLDRHEIFHGSMREKSKRLGLWVSLCHSRCHIYGKEAVHNNREIDLYWRVRAERAACSHYGWSTDEFIFEFGKNYL